MTTNKAIPRSEEVRKRKSQSGTSSHTGYSRKSSHKSYQSTSTSKTKKKGSSTITRRGVYQPNYKQLDSALRNSRTKNTSSELTLPEFGPRWLSAILVVLMGFLWITLWNSDAFVITGAELSGNVRLVDSDINAVLPAIGESIFLSTPEQIEKDLAIIFPDIESIDVRIGFPNKVGITIQERTPAVIWIHPDGSKNWIDIHGFTFPIRGEVGGLVTITSFGDPPIQNGLTNDGQETNFKNEPINIPYIQPAQISNIIELNKLAPVGAEFSYSPKYGLGWKDPQGWRGGSPKEVIVTRPPT
ncbi:cell division protein FtsQ/DivIB, partial [Chloroflexota bacterium]